MEKEIIRLHVEENLPISKISSMTNVSYYKVEKILTDNNIKIIKHSVTKSFQCNDISLLKKLISENKKYSEIAKVFNVSTSKICNWCKEHNIKTNSNKINLPKSIVDDYKRMSPRQIGEKYDVSSTTVVKKLKEHGVKLRSRKQSVKLAIPIIEKEKLLKYGFKHFPKDMKFTKRSKAEIEMQEYFENLGINFNSDRTVLKGNLELDLFCKDNQKAIELCGLIFHCEGLFNNRGKDYHYNKWKECYDKDIQLYTIFSHELKENKEKIYNFLRSQMGIFEKRIYARDCQFTETHDLNFLNDNHIQGIPKHVKRGFSLIHEGVIVGTVTYAKHHRNLNVMTLNRMCFKSNLQIIGGTSKLLKNSLREMDQKIVTWSDNRFSNGNVYKLNGFNLEKEYKADYFYTNKNEEVRSKQSMQKSKIGCPSNVTERDFCLQNGWYRVFDCGKKKWVFKPS